MKEAYLETPKTKYSTHPSKPFGEYNVTRSFSEYKIENAILNHVREIKGVKKERDSSACKSDNVDEVVLSPM